MKGIAQQSTQPKIMVLPTAQIMKGPLLTFICINKGKRNCQSQARSRKKLTEKRTESGCTYNIST